MGCCELEALGPRVYRVAARSCRMSSFFVGQSVASSIHCLMPGSQATYAANDCTFLVGLSLKRVACLAYELRLHQWVANHVLQLLDRLRLGHLPTQMQFGAVHHDL